MSDRLDRLIAEGEQLVPLGGSDVFTGPNRGLQDDYLVWHSRCVALLTELGPAVGHLLWELESDTRGGQFYQASASRVLGVMKAARLLT
jgi:hypothetical protein